MSIFGRTVNLFSVGCALALVLTVPAAAQAAVPVHPPTTDEVLAALTAGADPALSPARPSTSSVGWLTAPPFDVPFGALLVNSPGTDDTTLYIRIDPMRGDLRTVNVVYPESLWPIISGKSGHLLPIFAPTYDRSVAIAVDHNLETMAGLGEASDKPYVVYAGYSQGADALGDAAVRAHAEALLDPATDEIILISDPRSPWGLMQFAADHPLLGAVFCLAGATPDGARDPADTGADLRVTSVIIDGDPAANFQWVWYRPIASLVVNAAGFLSVHTTLGPQSYADLAEIEDVETLYSRDGRTTYLIYHVDHPLTQVTDMALRLVGIHLGASQVDRLNAINDAFYPLQQPSPQRAAPDAPVTATAPAARLVEDEPSVTPAPADAPESSGLAATPEVRDPATVPRSPDSATPDGAGPAGDGIAEMEVAGDDASVEGEVAVEGGDTQRSGAEMTDGIESVVTDEAASVTDDAQRGANPGGRHVERSIPLDTDTDTAVDVDTAAA